ncbi:MAG: hypothetical protein K2L14_00100 [Duncaniella sp.]|nr:hypothetical protein [Duncaniella sp.]
MKYTASNYIRRILPVALGCLVAAAFGSCADEALMDESLAEGQPDCITFRCTDMVEVYKGVNNYASRADLSKNPEEKEIKTLHVFFFDQESGDLLTSNSYANFPAYQKVTDMSLIKVPTGEGIENLFGSTAQDKKVHIVAIANIHATDAAENAEDEANKFCTDYSPNGEIRRKGREATGERFKITNISDLKDWVYYPRVRMDKGAANDISRLPSSGMPMIGELENVDLSAKPSGDQYIVNLRALMAKINVSVKLEPKQSAGDFPILKITEYGVRNMPVAVPFYMPDGEVKAGKTAKKPASFAEYVDIYNVTDAPMYHNDETVCPEDREFDPADKDFNQGVHEYTTTAGLPVTINKDSKPVLFSYYTYENINLPNYGAMRPNGEFDDLDAFTQSGNTFTFNRPSGISDQDNLQRWKPTIAYENCASALILKGEYTTDQELTYKAQFTIYIGGDTSNDISQITTDPEANYRNFKVKRNHQYNNNIVIHGLDYVRNSSDRVYTFDGRVNVMSDNPLYLSIVNERMVDAHATALPMDIWITNTEDATIVGDITFEVENHNSVNWVRMDYVDAETMKEGRDTNGDGIKDPYAPGTGAKPYFTYNLLDELSDNYIMKVPAATGNRSRIYFYIDENVPQSNDDNNYGTRTAVIKINYDVQLSDGTIENRGRTLDIDQAALLKVSGVHPQGNVPVTWMEYYEEYLEHSDPLDRHEQPGELYSGLYWGLDGINCSYSTTNTSGYINPDDRNNAYHVYGRDGAFGMTRWAVDRSGIPITSVNIYNDTAPASAFHYCYGKNKRNADGSAHVSYSTSTSGFLGLTTNVDVAVGWYMPGIRELEVALTEYYNLFTDEFKENLYWSAAAADGSNNYARATGVIINGSTVAYVQSSSGQDGYVTRTGRALRIRAFYSVYTRN